jgi:flagellar protein FliS
MLSLNFEDGGDIANKLYSLYIYFNKRLVDGNIQKKAEPLKEVLTHLENLRESWAQVATQSNDNEKIQLGVNIST